MKLLIAASIYPPDIGGPALHAQKQSEYFKASVVALRDYRNIPWGLRHIIYFFALKAYKYDVILAHDAFGVGIPALLASKLFRKRLVIRVGGDLAWERWMTESNVSLREWYEGGIYHHSLIYRLTKYVMQRANVVIVPSPLLEEIYTQYYALTNVKVIFNPLPEKRSSPTYWSLSNVMFAGRLVSYKNLDMVVRAFRGSPKSLTIIGDGPEREELKRLSSINTSFTGQLDHEGVMTHIAGCMCVIAPAFTEFNPNSILEAIACGKPILISREHGLPFEVPSEYTFNPRNEREFVERLDQLLEPINYLKACEWVKNLDFKWSWEDNLKAHGKALA